MKKIAVASLCVLLLVALLLPCGALSLIDHTRFTYLGYQTLIAGEENAPENFIHYQQIRSLGSFRKFYCTAGLPVYSYTLKDSAKYILKLVVSHYGIFDDFVPDVTYTLSDLAEEGDFRRISSESVAENDHGGSTRGIIEHENIQYRYYNETLSSVAWEWNDIAFVIYATEENQTVTEHYPVEAHTFMSKLLNSETAVDTLQELQGEIEENAEKYRMEAVRMRLNIFFAVGIVVIGALIIFFILRRKRKKCAA